MSVATDHTILFVVQVSPVKICLKGVDIVRPSSSSNSSSSLPPATTPGKTGGAATATTPGKLAGAGALSLELSDDNATFPPSYQPSALSPTLTDISKDLAITDDSDIEASPVKRNTSSYSSPAQGAGEAAHKDLSSAQGISSLLRSVSLSLVQVYYTSVGGQL